MSPTLAIALIPLGLVLAGFGFWAQGHERSGLAVAGNLAAPTGVLLALAGTLGAAVPGFFG